MARPRLREGGLYLRSIVEHAGRVRNSALIATPESRTLVSPMSEARLVHARPRAAPTARQKLPMRRVGGLPRSSAEAAVMAVERKGQVIAVDLGQLACREEPFVQRKAAAFARWHEPDDARVSSPDL